MTAILCAAVRDAHIHNALVLFRFIPQIIITTTTRPYHPNMIAICFVYTCLLTSPRLVPLRTCQAFLEAKHPKQDARRCQGCRLCHSRARILDCWSSRARRSKLSPLSSYLLLPTHHPLYCLFTYLVTAYSFSTFFNVIDSSCIGELQPRLSMTKLSLHGYLLICIICAHDTY